MLWGLDQDTGIDHRSQNLNQAVTYTYRLPGPYRPVVYLNLEGRLRQMVPAASALVVSEGIETHVGGLDGGNPFHSRATTSITVLIISHLFIYFSALLCYI
ncbi:MAG: hypothetical protein ACE5GG_02200 [Candidatus Omnitrophota bacterium]